LTRAARRRKSEAQVKRFPYVVTILCTLGIICVFSLSVVGKTISWKVAAAAYATVAALGTLAGLLTRTLS
jgi:hypothetical protein